MNEEEKKKGLGFSRGLTNYGDRGFSLYLRRSFASSMGYSREMLDRPDRRHRPFGQRLQQLPPPLSGTDRGGQARRPGGGRLAGRVPDDLAGRGVPEPDQPEVPQPDVDGRRGDDPRPADGLGRPARRLRQDGAGPAHGSGFGRCAGDPARRRPDVHQPPPGRAARRLHRLPALLGDAIAPATSTTRKSTRSSGGWRARPVPAPSWARRARWHRWPKRSA